MVQVHVTDKFGRSSLISQMSILDLQSTSNQPSRGQSNFGDSSGPLFSIYSKAADEEDNKMVERWQKDADGILIFVRLCVLIHIFFHVNGNTVDRSILSRGRCPPCCYRPGSEAEQSGHLSILPWQHLSRSSRPECNALVYSFPSRQTAPIYSSEIRSLGEFSLVLEPRHERQLCSVCDIFASMGTSISPYGSASTVSSREASTNACILFQWRGEDARSMGSRRIAGIVASLTVSLLWRADHFSVQYRPRSLHLRCFVDRALFNGVRIHHATANNLAR